MERIKFEDNPQLYNPDSGFVAHLSGIKTKQDLFAELSNKLRLPHYFGFNWDALSDCLRDFHWINERGIVLVHDEFPALDEGTLTTYLQVLNEAIQSWKEGKEHYFEIVFPNKVEGFVKEYFE